MGGLLLAGVVLLFCLTPAVYAEEMNILDDTLDPALFEEKIVVRTPTIHIVNESGSIGEAVARANAGDQVLVESGTYYETVDVDRALELRGIDTGGGMPVVSGNGSTNLFTLSGGRVVLDGFVVNGSGIAVISDRNVISNNTIIGGDILLPVRTGGNVICDNLLEGGNVSIARATVTTLRGNTLLNGSIALKRSYDLTVRDNLIVGGGLTLLNVADGAFFKNTILDNPDGCAFDVQRSFCNIIAGNLIEGCGYGFRTGGSANHVYLNTFANNNIHVEFCDDLSEEGYGLWSSPEPVKYVLNGSAFYGRLGNYWDDLIGDDTDGDGVLDEAYPVGACGIDLFPLAFPEEHYNVTYLDERP